jgi:hypothetical protein
MRDLLRLFTPPEWSAWNLAGRVGYLVVFAGIMFPVILFARWLSDALFR